MKKREKFLKKTREKMEEALRSRDMFLARVSRTIDEFNDVLNVLGERLEDMFRLYSPDLEVVDKEKYAQMILLLGKDVDMKELSKLFGSAKANEIAKKTASLEIEEKDMKKCKEFAQEIVKLYKLKEEFEKYEEELCSEVCPNMAYIGGSSLAAKLIAHVGSLRRLALLPSSTMQVIGAEKALFKHLKNKKVKPPKHGLIFQHAKVSNSPRKVRGRIARTLASKLTSAAKADAFTKNFIGEKLKKEFEERYKKVMEEYKKREEKKN